ncbi:DUF4870 domain-containing protein [Natrinema longum]|uniref:DUF4870 domain-containing protein n=1 Tax=Natrinema longum TaxID=370324 RepID=A0A8A2UC65_9EURY|nr:hypothetical protein [Natrinema longum]MBZ6495983.1 hypothetical protein [Natrinema longum]QSW86082.1 hypothetical protein J0X27_04450 [Natrinema longum]
MSTRNEPATGTTTAASSATSLGPDGNVLGAIAYLFSPLTGILIYLLEDENEFARFHAAQSIVFGVASTAIYIALNVFTTVVAMLVGDVLGFLIGILSFLSQMGIGFALLLVWLYLLVMAFQGNRTSFPVIGPIAENNLL